jgi:hypothetical protein
MGYSRSMILEYTSFVCEQTDLEVRLNVAGREGWRLHTCEPISTVGPSGSGLLSAFVVMDRVVEHNSDPEDFSSTGEGIAMKG